MRWPTGRARRTGPPSPRSRPRAAASWIAILLAAAAAGPPPASAQDVVTERQVPVDPVGGVLEIGPELRRDLGLFPGVDGFVSARLFLLEGGGHVLEIARRVEGRLVRERRRLDESDLEAFRREVASALALRGGAVRLEREGRGGLVLGETLLGLGFYGWALPQALGLDGSREVLAAYLLTAGASFYVAYRLTRDVPVTDAHRNFTLWGGTRGIVYGLAVGNMISGDDPSDDNEWELGMGVAASVLGSLLAFEAVDRLQPTEGTADLWGLMGDFGLAYGFAGAYALGLYDEDDPLMEGDVFGAGDGPRIVGHGLALATGVGGLAFGYWLGQREDYTVGDVHVLRSFGLAGGQVVLPLMWAVSDEDEATLIAGTMAGVSGGLWLGNRLLRDESFPGGDGLLVAAGHLAGGLGALGVTYLIDDGRSDALLYLATTALGSAAGLALTYNALRGGGPAPAGGGTDAAGPGDLTVEVSPAAAPLLLFGTPGRDRPVRVPLLTLRF